jgi:hypothetical protein
MHKRRKYMLLAGMALISLLTSCLNQAIETAIPIPTFESNTPSPSTTIVWFPATATSTPVPTIELSPTPLSYLAYGDQLVMDSFSDEKQWVLGSYAAGNAALGADVLSLAVAAPGGTLTSFRRDTYFSDFYLEVNAASSLCSSADSFGVAFWAVDASNYYRMALSCAGMYRLERVRGDKVTELTDWLPSAQIVRGPQVSVRVGLWSGGGLLRFFLNDIYQSEVRLPHATGGLGFFTQSNSSSAVTAVFSDLAVYDVSPDNYPPTPEPTIRPSKTPLPTIPTP